MISKTEPKTIIRLLNIGQIILFGTYIITVICAFAFGFSLVYGLLPAIGFISCLILKEYFTDYFAEKIEEAQ